MLHMIIVSAKVMLRGRHSRCPNTPDGQHDIAIGPNGESYCRGLLA